MIDGTGKKPYNKNIMQRKEVLRGRRHIYGKIWRRQKRRLPGRLTLAHKSDEYASIEEMKMAAKIMALSAVDLLGLAE